MPRATAAPAVVAAPAALPSGVTTQKIGWNVVGLDSNRVDVGPNQFPNGVRICNDSGSTATGHANWTWLDATYAAYINLAGDDSVSWSIANGDCQSIYWTVEITRNTSSYFTTRNFDIDVTTTAPAAGTTSVVDNQQIYVEKLVSQNRNSVGSVTGPGISPDTTEVIVGQEYTYTLTGSTAPGGYEQLEFAAIFDPNLFQVLEVNQVYTANTAPADRVPTPNMQMYADACEWDNDPESATYRECLDEGKAGGAIVSTFRVKIKAQGTSEPLNTLIYDFSGSSFHYNADYGFGPVIETVLPALAVTKTASTSTYTASGQSITFTITGTNTGDDTLINLAVDDTTTRVLAGGTSSVAGGSCSPTPSTTLAPGASFTCTVTYSTTANDVSAGSFTNTGTVRATGQVSGESISDAGSVSLTYTAADATGLTKTASPSSYSLSDDSVHYTLNATSTNSGKVDWYFTDALIDVWDAGCPTKLNLQAPVTCGGYHLITQADRDRGYITNVARVRLRQGSSDRTGTATTTIYYTGASPGITLTKSASPTTYTASDDTIGYSFVVTNTGDDTLSNLTISDAKLAAPANCPVTALAAGASTTCTGTHTITQADRNAGSIVNTAKAITTSSAGDLVTAEDSVTVTNGASAAPALTLTKTSTSASFSGAGDVIPYTFTVVNTGDVTVSNISIDDTQVDGAVTCQATSLSPDDTTTCVGRHTVTSADVSAGQVVNVATATGTPSRGTLTSPTATLTVPYVFSEITIVKTSQEDTAAGVGSNVTFDLRIINTGNTTLDNVTVDDTIVRSNSPSSGLAVSCTKTLPFDGFAVGDSFDCTVNYTLIQADVDEGVLNNTAFVTATDPGNVTVDDSSTAQVLGPTPAPRLRIVKVAETDTYYNVDDTVYYSYKITNLGNVTVANVAVDDPMVEPQPIPCTATTLAPKQSTTCQAHYVITTNDTVLTWLSNTATATGDPTVGVLPPVTPSTAYVLRKAPPAISVTKTSSDDTFAQAGDTVVYSITTSNTSADDTLYDLTVTDPLFSGAGAFGGLSCYADAGFATPTDDTTLNPHTSIYCRATYTVAQSDVDTGYVNNTVTAIGLTDDSQPLIARDSVTITGPDNVTNEITVVKSTDDTVFTAVGQVIPFSFLVTNTGDVTLTDIEVLDGTLDAPATCPTPATLAPDDTFICTGNYTATAIDLANKQVVNTASATGVPVRGAQPTALQSTVYVPSAVPALTVAKSTDDTFYGGSGTVLAYAIVVTNTGDDTLTISSIDDTVVRSGASDLAVSLSGCSTPLTLNVDDSITCTGSYTTTSTDIAAADDSVVNTVMVTGAGVTGGTSVTADDSVTSTYVATELTVAKTTDDTAYAITDDTLSYSIRITNSGDDTITGVTLDDTVTRTGGAAVAGTIGACSPVTLPGTLNPGQYTDCPATYVTVAADVDDGDTVVNTATARGTGQTSGVAVSGDDSVTSTYLSATVTVVKSVDDTVYTASGQTLAYTIVLTNTGDDTVTLDRLDDTVTRTGGATVAGTLGSCSPVAIGGSLSKDDSTTCTATYATTSDDTTSGDTVVNLATLTATAQSSGTSVTADDSVTSSYLPASLTVSKTTDDTEYPNADDTLTYTIVITNTGDDTLTISAIDDTVVRTGAADLAVSLSGCTTPLTLNVDDSITCTGEYVTVSTDLSSADDSVVNFVYVTGTAVTSGVAVNADDSVTSNYDSPVTPAMTVVKTQSSSTYGASGETISYTIVITNSGDDTLTNVTLDDTVTRTGGSALALSTTCSPISLSGTLNIDDSTTCTATYTTLAGDATSGGTVTNTATVTATPNSGGTLTRNDDVTATYVDPTPPTPPTPPGPTPAPALSVTKSASPTTFSKVGEKVTFTVVVANSGNVALTGVAVTDPMVSLTCSPTTPASLAAGASITCTGSYVVTQADVDAGSITNTATANGTDPNGTPTSGKDSATVIGIDPLLQGLTVTKQASPSTFASAGEPITFTVVVANTATKTLSNVTVSDPMVSLTCSPSTPVTALSPGQQITCSGTYRTSQADVDAGAFTNTATATGTDPAGKSVTAGGSATITSKAAAGLKVTKTAFPSSFSRVGEKITFNVVATNTGAQTLADVTVKDPQITLGCTPSTPVKALASGAKVRCTGTYTTTQADLDAGSITNTATGTAKKPDGDKITEAATAEVTANTSSSLAVAKIVSPTTYANVGDVLTYTVVVTNTGTTSLSNVTVADPKASLTCSPSTPVATLAPAATITCSGEYAVNQADIDSSSVTNTATATGTDPSGKTVQGEGKARAGGPVQKPSLYVSKTMSPSTFSQVGQKLAVTIIATNVGNVTLTNVRVVDTKATITCSPATPVPALAPGGVITCNGTYTVTQADMDAGRIDNIGTGAAKDDAGETVRDASDASVPAVAASPSLSLTKSAKPATAVKGQQVTYTFKVTNTGNVTISKIAIDDQILSKAPSCPKSRLESGQSMTCTATYTVTKKDEKRGFVLNTATVDGKPARGILTPASAQATVEVEVTWIKADREVTDSDRGKEIVVDNGRTSPNLGKPRYKVSCKALLARPRGDVPLCTHVNLENGIKVQTYGIPSLVTVTVYAPLKSDPSVIVKKKYTFTVQ